MTSVTVRKLDKQSKTSTVETTMKTFESVIRETRRVAKRNPLKRNSATAYFSINIGKDKRTKEYEISIKPSCIFGHALKNLGIDGSVFTANNYMNNRCIGPDGFTAQEWAAMGIEPPTDAQREQAQRIQDAADAGKRWIIAAYTR